MASEQNHGTSYPPSEQQRCANGCGFFGTAANMNLCSKCYNDFRVKEEQAASAKAAMEKSLNPKAATKHVLDQTTTHQSAPAIINVGSSSSSSAVAASEPSTQTVIASGNEHADPPKAANRCFCCNKKVGLTGFKCKCGLMLCGVHRYPEKHECSFDFKSVGREAIAMSNPVIKADKLDRI